MNSAPELQKPVNLMYTALPYSMSLNQGRKDHGIYYSIAADNRIYLLTVYAKSDCTDLTREQIKALRKLVEVELQ